MTFATVKSCTLSGVNAVPVTVEVHTTGGLPSVSLVGLPQSAVRESKDRVRAAIQNTGFDFPQSRVTINLAPADLPKQGGRFDLPIALGVMLARGYLPAHCLDDFCVVGELGLNGEVRGVNGVLPSALALRQSDTRLLCPDENLLEAIRSEDTQIVGAGTLQAVVNGLINRRVQSGKHYSAEIVANNAVRWNDTDQVKKERVRLKRADQPAPSSGKKAPVDFSDVKGHLVAKRVLEIAAAGAHNVLLIGPPGTGKSMLATRLATVLPPMDENEALESASVQSIRHGEFDVNQFGERPFRSPHHTASASALIGGGHKALPGEVSLAHNGVLFLDEMAEFSRAVLDAMREPMEAGCVHVSRLAHRASYPSVFQLIGATNPCPCGYFGDPTRLCRCTEAQLQNYRSRLSGPLLDRIDLQITVERSPVNELLGHEEYESSAEIRQRVIACRAIQNDRQRNANQYITSSDIMHLCRLGGEARTLLSTAGQSLNLSHRAVHRCLRVARTIADLAGRESVEASHLIESLSYRLHQQ